MRERTYIYAAELVTDNGVEQHWPDPTVVREDFGLNDENSCPNSEVQIVCQNKKSYFSAS